MTKILAVNAGSSTLKWKLFLMPDETVIASGLVDRLNLPGSVRLLRLSALTPTSTWSLKITSIIAWQLQWSFLT